MDCPARALSVKNTDNGEIFNFYWLYNKLMHNIFVLTTHNVMKLLPAIAAICLLSGCETYHLSTESMLEQFANVQKEKKINILIAPPYFFFPGIVNGNDLTSITVLDKKEQSHTIPVNRKTGVKITKKDGTKTTFYFDTLLLEDSTIKGSKTHFFNAKIKPIYFKDISKIELQK